MQINKIYIFLTTPFICFIVGYLACSIIIGNKTFVTPNLTGLTIYEAVKKISPNQINIRILSEKENLLVPAGTIINQKPSPGRLIKPHQQILITTTKLAPEVLAPALQKVSLDEIEKKCYDLGLKHKFYPIEYPAPTNSCIAQIPEMNSKIDNKKITVYIAKNKQDMYLMPDLAGKSTRSVLEFLKNYNARVSLFSGSKKITKDIPTDSKVISQKPLSGSIISMESMPAIQLTIA